MLVPISGINQPVLTALQYAMSLSTKVQAVLVRVDDPGIKQIQTAWKARNTGVELIVLQTPYRTIVAPLMEYIDVVKRERITDLVTVILPEFVPRRWWHHLPHNQTALLLKGALLFRKDVIVTDVPYHLGR